jgi:amino acid adenylation domain-containing protein/non-ribosomal peptide synthase protein (TIGR01720 family)
MNLETQLASQARLDSMSPAKRALFAKRLAGRRPVVEEALVPMDRSTEIPLSSAQRRLWFMDQLAPGSAVLNLAVALRLTGPLKIDALGRAVHEVFSRHESLRTVFARSGDRPVQRILPEIAVAVTPVPLPEEGDADVDARLRTLLDAEVAQPFSLEHGPLARTKVVRCGPEDHMFALIVHHSVCDGWSLGTVVDELLELYAADLGGRAADLEPLPLQFADYAGWEARPSRAGELTDDLEYWRRTLHGAPVVAELPLDRPRPAEQSFRGALHEFALPSEVWEAVKHLAREEHTTPFVVLLAGFSALLARYSTRGEVTVATPVANRPRVELESMVGFFANSIALRVDASDTPTFLDLVGRTREITQEGLAHSAVPFDRVVEAVDPPRSLGWTPIAQVSFALTDDPALDRVLDELRVRTVGHHTGTAKYELTMEMWPGADGQLHGTLEYATDLFDGVTARRLATHFGSLLQGLVCAPGTRVEQGVEAPRHALGQQAHDRFEHAGSAKAPGAPGAGDPPVTPLEQTIANVWAAVLGLPSVGRDADFLALGGHSLLATQAVARLRDALRVDIPLRAFFRATSLADLATRIEALGGKAPRPDIAPAPQGAPVPLSYAQGRLYFLSRLAEDSGFYNVPVGLRFDGRLDRAAFRSALAALWDRHEGLRTYFPSPDGEPVQELLSAADVPYEEIDLTGVPNAERLLADLVDEESRKPFDLARGPLLRAQMVRMATHAHVLLMTTHHAVSDGWSLDIVLDELFCLYRAFAAGKPSPLAPLPVTYADYTLWQRSWLEGPELATQLDYWTRQLADVATLELPTDRPRPAIQSFRGARHELAWPLELSRSIGELARREGVSLFTMLLAGFDVLLARASGQRDIVVGTPVANRTATEVEPLVGFFANTLALRVDLSGDPTFSEVLRRVREVAHGAYAHQDVPFEMVVDAVAPVRSLSHSPLFQVRFAVQKESEDLPDAGDGLVLTELEGEQRTARFDLVVDMWESKTGLEGRVEYSTDLFDADTVSQLMAQLEALFEQLVLDPGARVFGLDTLSVGERESLAALGRGADLAPGAAGRTFMARVAEQALLRPDAPAVTCGAVTLSYGELHQRAGVLAGGLVERGAGPGTMVAVYLERSVELLVAVLAVLEAGAAYVPLDPGYPAERLASIVSDTRPTLVLTTRDLSGSAPTGPGTLLTLEDTRTWTLDAVVAPEISPDHPAYVVHTSGTAGHPKGVVLTHGGLSSYVETLPEAVGLPDAPTYLHTASFAFSSSVRQFAVALSHGGHVVIAPRALLSSPEELLDYAAEHEVDVLDLVPSYLRVVEPTLARYEGWRPGSVFTASEPLLYDLPETLRGRDTRAPRLVNMYGQTETTGIVAAGPVPQAREGRGAVVPLGRPIPGVRLYILDERLRPVPAGRPGEIFVGGPGLAQGYLGDPAMTAQRFIADPFGPAGARFYRTGDRGRFLPSGAVEFLGRTGDQVKIRGHRVEPDEVASVLASLDSVRECAVICWEGGADERRLVGYAVLHEEVGASAATLRAALKERLPDYMVPTLSVVEALPRLSNGKIDRAALRTLEPAEEDTCDVGPSGRFEEALAAIWQDVLRVSTVGTQDDFFALGGDSLHVIRVVDRARKAGISVTPAQFIANPTLSALASVATEAAGTTTPGADGGPIPLVPSHLAFLERDFESKELYTHPFMFEASEPLDARLMERAVEAVVRHHESLRIYFPNDAGAYRVRVRESFEREPFTNVDLSALGSADQDTAFQRLDRTLHRKLDYANGPLLHVALVKFGPERPDRLVVIVHHQLMDNSSWDVLMDDLRTAYAELAVGQEPQLPPPTSSFAAWARNLDGLAHSAGLDEDAAYWTGLARLPVPQLPVDHEDGDNCMSSERSVSIRLSPEDTAALRQNLARSRGLSVNDTLLAALLGGYAEWSGQSSMLVDLVARGRELGGDELDLSRAIGRFSMTSPRLLETLPDTGHDALLESVAAQLRAVPRAGLGFGLLRYIGAQPSVAAALAPLGKPHILLSNWGEYEQQKEGPALLGPALDTEWPTPKLARMHQLIVNGGVSEGALSLTFRYSENLHRHESIARLAELVDRTLRSFLQLGGC